MFLQLLLGLVERRPQAVADVLLAWTGGQPVADLATLEDEIEAFVDQYHGIPLARLNLGQMLAEVTTVLRQHRLALPADLALLIKAFISLESMGRGLDPNFHMAAEALPLLRQLVRARYQPRALALRGWATLRQALQLVGRLPEEIERDPVLHAECLGGAMYRGDFVAMAKRLGFLDPRVVSEARRMDRISFDELLEMTANGCPKPAMRSVEFARTHGVDLHVRSAFTWETGTIVTKEDDTMEQAIVSAVVHDADEAKVTIGGVADRPGIAALMFRALADSNINVDLIVQNTSDHGVTDISFTVPHSELDAALAICEQHTADIGATRVNGDPAIARVSVVGAGMKSHPGVAATVFETLAANDINIEMIATSAIRVSCVVAEADVQRAVVALHDAFGLADGPVYVD
jgi:predicted amino acid-binding ACT domain protein